MTFDMGPRADYIDILPCTPDFFLEITNRDRRYTKEQLMKTFEESLEKNNVVFIPLMRENKYKKDLRLAMASGGNIFFEGEGPSEEAKDGES